MAAYRVNSHGSYISSIQHSTGLLFSHNNSTINGHVNFVSGHNNLVTYSMYNYDMDKMLSRGISGQILSTKPGVHRIRR